MDTRFWGPSGWKLLHLVTFDYEYSAESASSFANFFETIPYILPCKYCRTSLTDYYRKHPYHIPNSQKNMINPMLDLKKWMYTIHNCVNGKLRSQGLHPESNPTYAQVKKYYTNFQKAPWNDQLVSLWDFLFSVAYHHPKESSFGSEPMPDCPKEAKMCKDPMERNKWNVLPWKKRMYWFRKFWVFLPAVLPQEIRVRWQEVERQNPPEWGSRRSMMAWIWRMRCGLDSTFRDPYTTVCKQIQAYSSDCGKNQRGITCRRTHRTRRNKTLKKTK